MIHPASEQTSIQAQQPGLPAVNPNLVNSVVDPEVAENLEAIQSALMVSQPGNIPTFRAAAGGQPLRPAELSRPTGAVVADSPGADGTSFLGLLQNSFTHEAITASTVNPDLTPSNRASAEESLNFAKALYFLLLAVALNVNIAAFVLWDVPFYPVLGVLLFYEYFTFVRISTQLAAKGSKRKVRCNLSWEAAKLVSRIAVYLGLWVYAASGLREPPVALIVAFIVYDTTLIASGVLRVCTSSVYMQDTVAKVQFVIGIIFHFGIQAIVFVCKYNTDAFQNISGARPALWVLQCLYFFLGPTFLILGVVVLISICRVGESNPLRLEQQSIDQLVTSCRLSLCIMLSWYLAYFTNFILAVSLVDKSTYDPASVTSLSKGLFYVGAVECVFGIITLCCRQKMKAFMLTKHNVLSDEDYEAVAHRRAIELAEARARTAGIAPDRNRPRGENNQPAGSRANQSNPNSRSNPAAPREPDVEYLEDSKISVDYFRMKGSVFFSAVAKDEGPGRQLIEKSQMMKIGTSTIPKEERVKFFTISSANGGDDILNSVVVDSNSKNSKQDSLVNRKRKLTQQEKELLNFDKQCLICRENTVDAIYSPCFHGGVCFVCAKDNLVRKNSCYYCREVGKH